MTAMTRLAAIAVESAVPMTKPFSTERRLEARWGADGSAISMRRRKLIGAV